MNADRSRDVLDRLFTQVLKAEVELVAHLIVHDVGYHDSARIGERLHSRHHVDAIPENIVAVDNDVADIDPDTELNAGFGWLLTIAFGHAALDLHGAAHSIDDA